MFLLLFFKGTNISVVFTLKILFALTLGCIFCLECNVGLNAYMIVNNKSGAVGKKKKKKSL